MNELKEGRVGLLHPADCGTLGLAVLFGFWVSPTPPTKESLLKELLVVKFMALIILHHGVCANTYNVLV